MRNSNEHINKTKIIAAFKPYNEEAPLASARAVQHVYGKNKQLCATDSRGYSSPRNLNPLELVLDASEGFIPLWAEGVNLRWRFNEESMGYFENPNTAKRAIKDLLAEALMAWGEAAPITFSENRDAWDFEILMRPSESCNINGCTLASAFFPDSGRHNLEIYPTMLSQPKEEQVETLIHELGHIFGLRHFFANISETNWPIEKYGQHRKFTIMNYGTDSVLTNDDKSDLLSLYKQVWSGELTNINGTRILQVIPFHRLGAK